MTDIICANQKCQSVVKEGIICIVCKGVYHRKCEKVKAGEGKENYQCKYCVKKGNTLGKESVGEEPEVRIVGLTDSESRLRKENESLKEEVASLKEIIKIVSAERDQLLAKQKSNDEIQEEGEWKVSNDKTKNRSRRSANFTQLKNRFEALGQNQNDKSPAKPRDDAHRVTKEKQKQTKKRVLLLTDSNGRGCSAKLQSKLGKDFEVSSLVKPNGKLENLVKDIAPLTKNLDKDDCVIILGGTNDVGINESYDLKLRSAVRDILKTSKTTNVIVNAIPKRFDDEILDLETSKANKVLHKLINNEKFEKNSKNVIINFRTEQMKRGSFTRHGLHLNEIGKNALTERLAELTKEIVGSKGVGATVNGGREEKQLTKPTFLEVWLGIKKPN